MRKITPSQALEKMKHFTNRIKRLQANEYSDKKFRTADLNRNEFEYKYVYLWHSIAVFNKNQERAKIIIAECRSIRLVARDYMIETINQKYLT